MYILDLFFFPYTSPNLAKHIKKITASFGVDYFLLPLSVNFFAHPQTWWHLLHARTGSTMLHLSENLYKYMDLCVFRKAI